MESKIFFKTIASDSLSQSTKRSRITLLLVSLLAFLIFRFGVEPSSFSLLGIRFSKFDSELFKTVMLFILIFLLLDFIFGAIKDLLAKLHELGELGKKTQAESLESDTANNNEVAIKKAEVLPKYIWLYKLQNLMNVVAIIRFALEIIVPIGFSAYTFFVFTVN